MIDGKYVRACPDFQLADDLNIERLSPRKYEDHKYEPEFRSLDTIYGQDVTKNMLKYLLRSTRRNTMDQIWNNGLANVSPKSSNSYDQDQDWSIGYL